MRAEFLEEKEKKLGNVCDIYRAETRQWPPGWQQTQHKKLPLFKFYYTINWKCWSVLFFTVNTE